MHYFNVLHHVTEVNFDHKFHIADAESVDVFYVQFVARSEHKLLHHGKM